MKRIVIFLLFFEGFFCVSFSQVINIQGSWNTTISNVDKVKEAGLDYDENLEIESANNQCLISLNPYPPYWIFWRVTAECDYSDFPTGITVAARRTGSGIPQFGGLIYDGTDYLNLTNISQYFFKGTLRTNNIPVQYKILGDISVTHPAKPYQATIIYTIIGGASGW